MMSKHRLFLHPPAVRQTVMAETQFTLQHYTAFKPDSDSYALPLDQAARAMRLAAATPAPNLPLCEFPASSLRPRRPH